MAMIEIDNDPSKKDLFWFGVMLVGFVAVLGVVMHYLWGTTLESAYWAWGIGGALSVVYWAVPPSRRLVYVGWMYAAFPIGWTVSHLVLAIVYFLILTPIGVLVRKFSGDPMQRRLEPERASYWERRERITGTDRYFRQF